MVWHRVKIKRKQGRLGRLVSDGDACAREKGETATGKMRWVDQSNDSMTPNGKLQILWPQRRREEIKVSVLPSNTGRL